MFLLWLNDRVILDDTVNGCRALKDAIRSSPPPPPTCMLLKPSKERSEIEPGALIPHVMEWYKNVLMLTTMSSQTCKGRYYDYYQGIQIRLTDDLQYSWRSYPKSSNARLRFPSLTEFAQKRSEAWEYTLVYAMFIHLFTHYYTCACIKLREQYDSATLGRVLLRSMKIQLIQRQVLCLHQRRWKELSQIISYELLLTFTQKPT